MEKNPQALRLFNTRMEDFSMYVYAISNNCNYEITVSNGYAKKESAFLDMIAEMNTALHDMSIPSCPARTSLWTTSPLRKASPAARCHSPRMAFPSIMAMTAATGKWEKSREPDIDIPGGLRINSTGSLVLPSTTFVSIRISTSNP